jgi:hypothetical protein
MTALKSNSNTVWFNFQTYIYIYIYIFKDFVDNVYCCLNKLATQSDINEILLQETLSQYLLFFIS